MSSRMPILHKLSQGATLRMSSSGAILTYPDDETPWSDIRNPFDVQVASDIYWQSEQDNVEYDKAGRLKPPFPKMWMEWRVPSDIRIGGKWVPRPETANLQCAAMITENLTIPFESGTKQPRFKHDVNLDDGQSFHINLFINHIDHAVMTPPISWLMTIDDQGLFLHKQIIRSERLSAHDANQLDEWAGGMMVPAMVALGLINCRNVKTKESGTVHARRSGAQKRRGEKPWSIRYNTIILPGGGSESDGSGGHRATAVHRVRGHFKTFTAEKPLLGQHVGTYWWGWQVRGNPELGVVVSDYKVGV